MVAMAQSKANGQGGGLVPTAGGAVAIPTLLGRSAQRIPGGRPHPGAGASGADPARSQSGFPGARDLRRRRGAGQEFDAIERELAAAMPTSKNPLTPKNVPYFTVRGEDFPNPELALSRTCMPRIVATVFSVCIASGGVPGRCLAERHAA